MLSGCMGTDQCCGLKVPFWKEKPEGGNLLCAWIIGYRIQIISDRVRALISIRRASALLGVVARVITALSPDVEPPPKRHCQLRVRNVGKASNVLANSAASEHSMVVRLYLRSLPYHDAQDECKLGLLHIVRPSRGSHRPRARRHCSGGFGKTRRHKRSPESRRGSSDSSDV